MFSRTIDRMPSKRGKVGKALEKRRKGLQHGGRLPNTVSIIVGKEKVLLDDGTIPAASLSDRVLFSENYVPTGTILTKDGSFSYEYCMDVFYTVFGGSNGGQKMNINWPYYPDDPEQQAIITQGLQNRFKTLADEITLFGTIESKKAVLATRIMKLNALRELISAADGLETRYNYSTATLSEAANGTPEEGDEQARTLAQMMVVLYLTSKDKNDVKANEMLRTIGLPNKMTAEEVEKLDPDGDTDAVTKATALLGILGDINITDTQFVEYLQEWSGRNKGVQLPPNLSQIIALFSDSNLSAQRKNDAANEILSVFANKQRGGGPTLDPELAALQERVNKYVSTQAEAIKNNEVVDASSILSTIKEYYDDTLNKISQDLARCKIDKDSCTSSQELMQGELAELNKELSDLRASSDSTLAALETAQTALKEKSGSDASCKARLDALTTARAELLDSYTKEIGEKTEKIQELEEKIKGDAELDTQKSTEIQDLEVKNRVIQLELNALGEKLQEAVRRLGVANNEAEQGNKDYADLVAQLLVSLERSGLLSNVAQAAKEVTQVQAGGSDTPAAVDPAALAKDPATVVPISPATVVVKAPPVTGQSICDAALAAVIKSSTERLARLRAERDQIDAAAGQKSEAYLKKAAEASALEQQIADGIHLGACDARKCLQSFGAEKEAKEKAEAELEELRKKAEQNGVDLAAAKAELESLKTSTGLEKDASAKRIDELVKQGDSLKAGIDKLKVQLGYADERLKAARDKLIGQVNLLTQDLRNSKEKLKECKDQSEKEKEKALREKEKEEEYKRKAEDAAKANEKLQETLMKLFEKIGAAESSLRSMRADPAVRDNPKYAPVFNNYINVSEAVAGARAAADKSRDAATAAAEREEEVPSTTEIGIGTDEFGGGGPKCEIHSLIMCHGPSPAANPIHSRYVLSAPIINGIDHTNCTWEWNVRKNGATPITDGTTSDDTYTVELEAGEYTIEVTIKNTSLENCSRKFTMRGGLTVKANAPKCDYTLTLVGATTPDGNKYNVTARPVKVGSRLPPNDVEYTWLYYEDDGSGVTRRPLIPGNTREQLSFDYKKTSTYTIMCTAKFADECTAVAEGLMIPRAVDLRDACDDYRLVLAYAGDSPTSITATLTPPNENVTYQFSYTRNGGPQTAEDPFPQTDSNPGYLTLENSTDTYVITCKASFTIDGNPCTVTSEPFTRRPARNPCEDYTLVLAYGDTPSRISARLTPAPTVTRTLTGQIRYTFTYRRAGQPPQTYESTEGANVNAAFLTLPDTTNEYLITCKATFRIDGNECIKESAEFLRKVAHTCGDYSLTITKAPPPRNNVFIATVNGPRPFTGAIMYSFRSTNLSGIVLNSAGYGEMLDKPGEFTLTDTTSRQTITGDAVVTIDTIGGRKQCTVNGSVEYVPNVQCAKGLTLERKCYADADYSGDRTGVDPVKYYLTHRFELKGPYTGKENYTYAWQIERTASKGSGYEPLLTSFPVIEETPVLPYTFRYPDPNKKKVPTLKDTYVVTATVRYTDNGVQCEASASTPPFIIDHNAKLRGQTQTNIERLKAPPKKSAKPEIGSDDVTYTNVIGSILVQLQRGTIQKFNTGRVISQFQVLNDIIKYSTETEFYESPIVAFLNKYASMKPYFDGATTLTKDHIYRPTRELDAEDDQGKAQDDPLARTCYTRIMSVFWNGFRAVPTYDPIDPEVGRVSNGNNPFKRLIYDLFRALILQYEVNGANTTEEKALKIYPYWARYVGNAKIEVKPTEYLKKAGRYETQKSFSPTIQGDVSILRLPDESFATLTKDTMPKILNNDAAASIFTIYGITQAKLMTFALDTTSAAKGDIADVRNKIPLPE
jgi:hypothetical protein